MGIEIQHFIYDVPPFYQVQLQYSQEVESSYVFINFLDTPAVDETVADRKLAEAQIERELEDVNCSEDEECENYSN